MPHLWIFVKENTEKGKRPRVVEGRLVGAARALDDGGCVLLQISYYISHCA